MSHSSSSPRSIIFDFDLTLIRSRTIAPSWHRALMEAGLTFEEAVAAQTAGIGRPTRATPEAAGRFPPEQVSMIVARYEELLGDGDPEPLPGAVVALTTLRRAGHRLYLTTGTAPHIFDRVIARLQWEPMFHLRLGSDHGCAKGPEHYRRFIAASGLPPEEFLPSALAVGDGVADMHFALEAGVPYRCAFVAPTTVADRNVLVTAGANLVVTRLADLPALARLIDPLTSRWGVTGKDVSHMSG